MSPLNNQLLSTTVSPTPTNTTTSLLDPLASSSLVSQASSSVLSQGNVSTLALASPVVGNGNGLQGQYYDNIDFTNLKQTRTDATVNFNWGE
ncbi:hypothetical protein, partial [uncultured Nostoc sp.]